MASSDQPPAILRFSCPACEGILSLPASMAGVKGPCPGCQTMIVGPDPTRGAPPMILPKAPVNPPKPVAPPPRQVHCHGCGAVLNVDPNTTLSGGPCPACHIWISLSPEPAPIPRQAPLREPPSLTFDSFMTARLELPEEPTWPSGKSPRPARIELPPPKPQESPIGSAKDFARPVANAGPSAETPKRPKPEPDEIRLAEDDEPAPEREVRRKKKRRRVLPAECFVGAATNHLDDRGMALLKKSRRMEFPDGEVASTRHRRRSREESGGRAFRWLSTLAGLFIVSATSMALAVHYDLLDAKALKLPDFLGWKPPAITGNPGHLEETIRAEVERMDDRQTSARKQAEITAAKFFGKTAWDEAAKLLLLDRSLAGESVMAMLKTLPRERWAGQPLRFTNLERIPKTDRSVFTAFLPADDDKRYFFLVFEETEDHKFQLHPLALHQNWWGALSDFLCTPGAPGGRFYAQVAEAVDAPGERAIPLPADGPYLKLRLQDYFNGYGRQWHTVGFIREDMPVGIRLRTKINSHSWSRAVLDLEWREGPAGHPFIFVHGLRSSNWGDFP